MSPKLRGYLILAHLWAAAFMAPAFALHAISGGLYLVDQKGTFDRTELSLPAGAELDFKSETLIDDVKDLLDRANIDEDFEYIRDRGSFIQTRPTSEKYVELRQTAEGLTATQVTPDLVGKMIELHKGHGPLVFKTYQKLVAVLLLLVILGGVLVGLAARAYRRQTVIALALGTILFVILAI